MDKQGEAVVAPKAAGPRPGPGQPRPPERIMGFVELLDESGFHGWAYDRQALGAPATLVLHIDDTLIGRVVCDAVRPDVKEAGHPREAVGFHIAIPRVYFDDAEHGYRFSTPEGAPVSLIRAGQAAAPKTFRFSTFFDAEFYRRHYPEARGMTDLAAFNHWARGDDAATRHPNPDALFAALAKDAHVLPEDFSPLLYRFLNPAIAGQVELDWEAGLHFLLHGRADGLRYSFSGNSFVVDLYFGGIAPAAGELDAFVADHGKTMYRSLDDLLARHGIKSDLCLRYLNVSDYAADNLDLRLRTKMQCIRHFAEIGIKTGQALSYENRFDHAFVTEIDPRYADLKLADAYLLWINTAAKRSTPPNASVMLRNLGLPDLGGFPAGFSAEIYLDMNPDLRPTIRNRWAALRHAIEQGLPEGRPGCPISRDTAEIYRASADRQSVGNRLPQARKLYETLLTEDPRNLLGNRHYADCLLRQEEFYLAARVYEDTIAHGGDNVWTHLNLTTCYIRRQRWAEACTAIGRIAVLRGGDRAVQRRYRDVLRDSYAALAADAQWLAEHDFNDRARARITEACALLAAPLAPTMAAPARAPAPVRSVAIIADIGLPQCKFYRVDQKLEQLEAAGIDCQAIDYREDIIKFVRTAVGVDAVIFYRVPATPDVMWAIWLLRQAGVPTFFEIDDLMFDGTLFPEPFESYGGQIDKTLYATLVNGTVSLAAAMAVCDYALASTPALAAAMEPHVVGKRAFVHRNGLSRTHQESARTLRGATHGERVRIFYGSGTRAHNEDFDTSLAGPLARLFKKWGKRVELVVMGYLVLPPSLRPFANQISVHEPVWDLRTYWSVLREVDISLAVLSPGPVADAKSEIKWLEAAMLAVPSVVSTTRTYDEVIEDGRTGVIVRQGRDWFAALDALVADADRRRVIGQAARATVMERYGVAALAANLGDILGAVTSTAAVKKTRVLIVHVFYPPQSVGGATRVVADNVHDILAGYGDEFELEVFTTLEGAAEPYVPLVTMTEGVRVTAIPTPMEPELDRRVWDEGMQAAFEAVLDRFAPDIVHLHCIQRITLSVCETLRRRALPYVVTVHDGWWISDTQFLVDEFGEVTTYNYADPLAELRAGNAKRLERMKVKQASLAAAAWVLAVSEPFAAIYRGCGFTNVMTIANGVSDLAALPRLPSPDGRVRLAHIGGASFHKGYHHVRAALCQGSFANLHLLVIDHAMDPGAVRHAVWGRTEVTFRGKFSQARVAELYQGIDVLLAPSVWPESYGLVTREAMQAGCWVVASDRGAIGQDVTPENGFVVDVSTGEGLLRVFAEMDANPARYLEPVPPMELRCASDQAAELVELYRTLTGTEPAEAPVVSKPARKTRRAA